MIPSEVERTIALLRKEAAEKQAQGNHFALQAQALLRESQKKTTLADELEASFGVVRLRHDNSSGSAVNGAPAANGTVTIERLRNYLTHRGGRTNHLAKHFGVSEDVIKKLIDTPGSRISAADRGWLKVDLV